MTSNATLSKDRRTLTVRVPLAIKKRGGRKLVIAPDGATWSPPRAHIDNTMVKAIARAHRWKRLLESGQYASVAELAAAEKINQSYVCRVLRLTLLAPDIVELILDGMQPTELQMDVLLKPFPVGWGEQRSLAIPGMANFGLAQPEKKGTNRSL
ncbi:MAG: hypothetical protein HYX36_00360 [Rhizobiales bacterium]|nr:hypothetical protein [Hyphomicrobiales bacterium]